MHARMRQACQLMWACASDPNPDQEARKNSRQNANSGRSRMPELHACQIADEMSENMSGGMSANMTHEMSGKLSDRVRGRMREYVSGRKPDRHVR